MKYPALELLAQGYLTIDWVDDYEDVWSAVDDFVSNEPIAPKLQDELTELIESAPSESALRALVIQELDCGYLPESDGLSMTEWLEALRERVGHVPDD